MYRYIHPRDTMYPYIVCFCGRSIGDLYDAFVAMRVKKYAALGIDAEMDIHFAAISHGYAIDMSDDFDQLGLQLECCRARMASQVMFKELY